MRHRVRLDQLAARGSRVARRKERAAVLVEILSVLGQAVACRRVELHFIHGPEQRAEDDQRDTAQDPTGDPPEKTANCDGEVRALLCRGTAPCIGQGDVTDEQGAGRDTSHQVYEIPSHGELGPGGRLPRDDDAADHADDHDHHQGVAEHHDRGQFLAVPLQEVTRLVEAVRQQKHDPGDRVQDDLDLRRDRERRHVDPQAGDRFD